jgi:hypothetical protein
MEPESYEDFRERMRRVHQEQKQARQNDPDNETWSFLLGGPEESVGLNDLFDGKFTANYRPSPLEGKVPIMSGTAYEDLVELAEVIRSAATQIDDPFAVLLNPVTRLSMQMEYMNITCNLDPDDPPNYIYGLLMQAADFIVEGSFMIVNRQDYETLSHRSNIK